MEFIYLPQPPEAARFHNLESELCKLRPGRWQKAFYVHVGQFECMVSKVDSSFVAHQTYISITVQ
jgi:hypothetical protein